MAASNNFKHFLYFPPDKYFIFPLVSGSAWFITLLALLLFWIGQGRPRYPFQKDPEVAFISDIGAHGDIKPVFILGGIVTALAYAGTIFSANAVRHHYIDETKARTILARIALFGGVLASATLILLTIFDTDRFHNVHGPLLLLTFLGIAISGLATAVVYWDATAGRVISRKGKDVRKWLIANFAIIILELVVTIAFMVCLFANVSIAQGVLEWILAFMGAPYILTFVGLVFIPRAEAEQDGERQPLLQNDA